MSACCFSYSRICICSWLAIGLGLGLGVGVGLGLGLGHLYLLLVGDELAEGVIVAAVVGEPTPVQPHGVGAHRVEEVLSG